MKDRVDKSRGIVTLVTLMTETLANRLEKKVQEFLVNPTRGVRCNRNEHNGFRQLGINAFIMIIL